MNIILKSFDGPQNHIAVERALKGIPLGTVIDILWDKREVPQLEAKEHIVMDARDLKNGRYPGVDWTTITPLDEELIDRMRTCETTFMHMITRHSVDEIPYAERWKQYIDHLRYWNHVLDEKKIDFMLLNHVPHQSYDVVIYELCKLKGIRTLMMNRITFIGEAIIDETWEHSGTQVLETYKRLQPEYADPAKPIPLTGNFDRYFLAQTVTNERPYYLKPRQKYLTQRNFIRKWFAIGLKFLFVKPRRFFSFVFSPKFWKRKLHEHRTTLTYDENIRQPDLTKKYIFMPLHLQPEASSSPLGGAFVDQEFIVQLLAWHLPPDVHIYIKEHPHQDERIRSPEFYRKLVAHPCVTFVPRDMSSLDLMEKCIATATITGTAGFEGLFRGKPVLLFGHWFFQYAPGVHVIHTSDDCKRALESILVKKEVPALRDVRLFLKAIEDCSMGYDACPDEVFDEAFTKRVEKWGDGMHKAMQNYV